METQTTEQLPRKKNAYNKERYEQNKEEILKYRRERYRTIHKKAIELLIFFFVGGVGGVASPPKYFYRK